MRVYCFAVEAKGRNRGISIPALATLDNSGPNSGRAVVQTVRPEEVATLTLTDQTLGLWNRVDLGNEVLVRSRRNVERKLVELVVAAHVDPPIAFHQRRIALLV